MKALISSEKIPVPGGPYSPALAVGEWIFLSGQGGFDPDTGKVVSDDLVEQTEQTFKNIEVILEAAGASLDDVVSCLVHLVDLADFPTFNGVYAEVHRREAGTDDSARGSRRRPPRRDHRDRPNLLTSDGVQHGPGRVPVVSRPCPSTSQSQRTRACLS
jgi:2-iminobutanoate/2-iminopropanoate deaminase